MNLEKQSSEPLSFYKRASFVFWLVALVFPWICFIWALLFPANYKLRRIALSLTFCWASILTYGICTPSPSPKSTKLAQPVQVIETPQPMQERETPQSFSKPVKIPEFKILKQDVFDNPGKTQFNLNLLVSGEITSEGLSSLLQSQVNQAMQSTGYKYHEHPTVIGIYAYTSEDHANSGAGQWIGMISKTPIDDQPSLTLREDAIAAYAKPAETINGLSQEQRMRIWTDLIVAEDKARDEAEKICPTSELDLQVGMAMQLTRETPLMPSYDPPDPIAALGQMRRLQVGIHIVVREVAKPKGQKWFYINAFDSNKNMIGNGWINSVALVGQLDYKKQADENEKIRQELLDKYEAEVMSKYKISSEEAKQISSEGLSKNWPFPRRNKESH